MTLSVGKECKVADNRWDRDENRPDVKIYLHFEDGEWTWCNDRQEPDDVEYIDTRELHKCVLHYISGYDNM